MAMWPGLTPTTWGLEALSVSLTRCGPVHFLNLPYCVSLPSLGIKCDIDTRGVH